MEKDKGEKRESDLADKSSLIDCMKDQLKINGDIFSTGAWPSDEEIVAKYDEVATHSEAETAVIALIDDALSNVGD